ncbi:uncharacterized protein C8R40DRAFT_1074198 [Lentinula edodes]|uniref:uncharacterized protein n=1 Tax=Lentinula edodes TaxID=5353 RepID=UPI001E8D8538|nr:uncharacterized protein C8R40DRAFT_1074198 [Lentinula edodes]KAH7869245.1 hypothetical protein C8R40DRAFT_1074198 [Lentinula edodes]
MSVSSLPLDSISPSSASCSNHVTDSKFCQDSSVPQDDGKPLATDAKAVEEIPLEPTHGQTSGVNWERSHCSNSKFRTADARNGYKRGNMREDSYEEHPAQLILVSAHKAGSDELLHWITCDLVRQRLKGVFIDEAHNKIVTDSDFRSCFKRSPNLARSSVPITFLSDSLMPRYVPVILEAVEINDAAVVDEICQYSGRRNLKYAVERTVQEGYFENIMQLVQRENERTGEQDWGIIFLSTLKERRGKALTTLPSAPSFTKIPGSSLNGTKKRVELGVTDYRLSVLSFLSLRKIPWILITSFDSAWFSSKSGLFTNGVGCVR